MYFHKCIVILYFQCLASDAMLCFGAINKVPRLALSLVHLQVSTPTSQAPTPQARNAPTPSPPSPTPATHPAPPPSDLSAASPPPLSPSSYTQTLLTTIRFEPQLHRTRMSMAGLTISVGVHEKYSQNGGGEPEHAKVA